MIRVFDGHNDALMRYAPAGPATIDEFFTRAEGVCVDLPRAREGGLVGGIFAVFIEDDATVAAFADFDPTSGPPPVPALDPVFARERAIAMAANLHRIAAAANGKAEVIRDHAQLLRCMREGVLAMVLHFEGAEPIDADLYALELFYQAGLRSLGLVWSRPTIFAEGVPFTFPHSPDTGAGLTPAGERLVRACNRLGIAIDLSHLTEKGFWDVARISDAPLIASHSNAWTLTNSPRNLTDRQLGAIRDSRGIAGLNVLSAFVREDGRDAKDTPMSDLVRHVEYMVERMGIDHVGVGADLGVPSYLPDVFRDATAYPRLFEALRERGFDDAALAKIAHENWLRVLGETWK